VDEAKIREGLIAWREGLLVGWMVDGGAVVGLEIFGAKLGGVRWRVGCWTGEGRGGEGRYWVGVGRGGGMGLVCLFHRMDCRIWGRGVAATSRVGLVETSWVFSSHVTTRPHRCDRIQYAICSND